MGDRTPLQATIYACPDAGLPDAWQAITRYMGEPEDGDARTRWTVTNDTLNEHGEVYRRGDAPLILPGLFATEEAAHVHAAGNADLTGADTDDYSIDTVEVPELGEQYMVAEASCGSATEMADVLAEIPGIVFEVWEDPKYEWLGDLRMFTPELGMFSAECDSNGVAIIQPAELMAIVDKCETKAEIVAELGRATGKPWRDAIVAIGAAELGDGSMRAAAQAEFDENTRDDDEGDECRIYDVEAYNRGEGFVIVQGPIGSLATCGTCGFSWDDSRPTSTTPVPSGRCPFEYEHAKES